GALIAGATSTSYTTPPTTIADNNAQFTVTVTNRAGSITSYAVTLSVVSGSGLGGFAAAVPNAPADLIGTKFRFQVVTNQSQAQKIIFGASAAYASGSPLIYNFDTNVYSGLLAFANGGCTAYPPLGTYTEAQASFRKGAPDYVFASGGTPMLAEGNNTSDP